MKKYCSQTDSKLRLRLQRNVPGSIGHFCDLFRARSCDLDYV